MTLFSDYLEVIVYQILIELFFFKDSSYTTSFSANSYSFHLSSWKLLDSKTIRWNSIFFFFFFFGGVGGGGGGAVTVHQTLRML